MQNVCPWCSKAGTRCEEAFRNQPEYRPHADGSSCVCRHVGEVSATRLSALRAFGRYFTPETGWVCFSCETAPPATEQELTSLEED